MILIHVHHHFNIKKNKKYNNISNTHQKVNIFIQIQQYLNKNFLI